MLVDLRKSPVQSVETAGRIKAATSRIYKPGDRIAIVVQSSLVKTQMRQVVDVTTVELFISIDAAEMWLLAYS